MRHSEYIDALLWTFHVHLPALRVTLYFLFFLSQIINVRLFVDVLDL